MKTILKTLLLILSISLVGCKKEERDKGQHPISTLEITEITAITAVSGGEMKVSSPMFKMGICWSINPNPTVDNFKINNETDKKRFSCIMTNLTPNTKYYVRAFNIWGLCIEYGEQVEFTTLEKDIE